MFSCENALDNDINTFWLPDQEEPRLTSSGNQLHSISLTFNLGTTSIDKIAILQRGATTTSTAKKVRQAFYYKGYPYFCHLYDNATPNCRANWDTQDHDMIFGYEAAFPLSINLQLVPTFLLIHIMIVKNVVFFQSRSRR